MHFCYIPGPGAGLVRDGASHQEGARSSTRRGSCSFRKSRESTYTSRARQRRRRGGVIWRSRGRPLGTPAAQSRGDSQTTDAELGQGSRYLLLIGARIETLRTASESPEERNTGGRGVGLDTDI
eukprot:2966941-Pyramimonas_sp.AAC.2